MKLLISGLVLILSLIGFAQQQQQLKINLYNEKGENSFKILVDNDEFCPVSMKIDLDLNNMASSQGNHKIFVIPAKTKGFLITTLQAIKANGGGGFKTQSLANYGDVTITQTPDYTYSLPFQKGKTYIVDQGYNGRFSHFNENSIDFTMPVGAEVLAARDGVVIKVVEENNQSCPERSCASFNNYILVYHKDGTFAQYVHLKQNGALVKEGDVVKENDVIGYSGQTGWANGPHLHFMVFLTRLNGSETRETLRTKFKIDDGRQSDYLKEKVEYTKNY